VPERPMADLVQQLIQTYYREDADATSDLARFMAIIDLYQALEALHPFKDATSRTNHLVLNKLLAEHGFNPAILEKPNSPVHTREEWAVIVLRGCRRGRRIAMSQGGGSELQGARHVDAEMQRHGYKTLPRQLSKPGAAVAFPPFEERTLASNIWAQADRPDRERERPRQVASNGEPLLDSRNTEPLTGLDAAIALRLWPNDPERHFRIRNRTSNS
jgi:hypothetical protein